MMIRLFLPLALLATAASTTAAAAPPPCDGQLMIVRVSKIVPAGTMAGYMDASKAQAAWYAAHGGKDHRFVTLPVQETVGDQTGASKTEVVSIHTSAGKAIEHKGDAAWDAFVAKYRANSIIESEKRVCLPKGTVIGG